MEIYLTALQVKMRTSSEDEDDAENASVTAINIEDDNQHIEQYCETSDDGHSLSYGLEDTRTPSNLY